MDFSLEKPRCQIIGADIPLNPEIYPVEILLEAFKGAVERRPNLRLVLTGRRDPASSFSVWNFIEQNNLVEKIEFIPYFDLCRDFPIKKTKCDLWVPRDTHHSDITAERILSDLDRPTQSRRSALFVTSFHPLKFEGNSALMRMYLEGLDEAGYDIHIVYYPIDAGFNSKHTKTQKALNFKIFEEVAAVTKLVNVNKNGLNVHTDDWCGLELLDHIENLARDKEFDIAAINYAFMSATLERVSAYTTKILLTHDSFADRNRRMLAQGYPDAGWMSLNVKGERLACERSDIVVAVQESEREYFRQLGTKAHVEVVGPIPSVPRREPPKRGKKLRVGYLGSSNYVNEYNVAEYMKFWSSNATLLNNANLIIGGGCSLNIEKHCSRTVFDAVRPRILGTFEDVGDFFAQCDVVINPDRGGTGIKIKTLEAMAQGCAVLTTAAGSAGINSASRFHAAEDADALAHLTAEVALHEELLEEARSETRIAYEHYVERHAGTFRAIIDESKFGLAPPAIATPQEPVVSELNIPTYVERMAYSYQIDEFRKFFSRVDVVGKNILEIGSDYHLVTARLFAANGAASVVATNIGDWRSEEPLPKEIRFVVGDVANLDLPEEGFDIVYGIAVLEHIPDMAKVAHAVRRALRPGGVAYLQGCPLWTGDLGHHCWVSRKQIAEAENRSLAPDENPDEGVYLFNDPSKNPIPRWAHLTHTPDELRGRLIGGGMPPAHATALIEWVYNTNSRHTGSSSNFLSATDVLSTLQSQLVVEFDRVVSTDTDDPEFQKALASHTEFDLATVGLEVWMAHDTVDLPSARRKPPTVSVIIPVYNVQAYLRECLESVAIQSLADLEVIIVDDSSQDNSLQIAKEFSSRDARFRIFTHSQNQGLGPARNTGVAQARGTYLFFLDSDDRFAGPTALAHLVAAARAAGHSVVVGSCEKWLPDGSLVEHDRAEDRARNGRPGTVMSGYDAFLSAIGMPNMSYIPMRAWGTLIERRFYTEINLDYPPGEHEDMAHTPFLYLKSDHVLYDRAIVVHYRIRSGSLSTSGWSAAKIERYGLLWRGIAARMKLCGVTEHIANCAVLHAGHLIWRIENNGLASNCEREYGSILCEIIRDAGGANPQILTPVIEAVRSSPRAQSESFMGEFMRAVPITSWLDYHRRKLGLQHGSDAIGHRPSPS
jgi:glycosyltransferase involved in cell wall biosynthesis/SAM-dependent methyltransferase